METVTEIAAPELDGPQRDTGSHKRIHKECECKRGKWTLRLGKRMEPLRACFSRRSSKLKRPKKLKNSIKGEEMAMG